MTNAEMAILSLIAEQARHGYEIEELITRRGMRGWTEIGFSSIYYLLKRLEKAGYVTSQLEPAPRGPARKVYTLTHEGFNALREGVLVALAQPHNSYPPLQLGLANLPILKNDETIRALTQHRDALVAQISQIQARHDEQQPNMPYFVTAMFDHSLTMLAAQRDWLDKFINQLQQMKTLETKEQ